MSLYTVTIFDPVSGDQKGFQKCHVDTYGSRLAIYSKNEYGDIDVVYFPTDRERVMAVLETT